jgi:hypothetical protein
MLTFTAAGVVSTPTTVQVRVAPDGHGLVRAHAAPGRALTDEELLANIRHLTEGQRGPRAHPCDALVLSGVPEARVASLANVIAQARGWGIQHVTLHTAADVTPQPIGLDAVGVVVRSPDDVARLRAWPAARRTAILVLDDAASFDACVGALDGVDAVAVTWPFPPSPPLPLDQVTPRLDAIAAARGDADWVIKGLPACLVGRHAARVRRSRNRFLVDADHPLGAARLFFPDVVRWAKIDSCRFCAHDARCDGVAREWLEDGVIGALTPRTAEG